MKSTSSSSGSNDVRCQKDDVIEKLYEEVKILESENRELQQYADKLILFLINKFPDVLEKCHTPTR